MGPTALFDTIHGSHYTILVNFYLYLQYFQQKVFNFNKIGGYQTNPKSESKFPNSQSIYLKTTTQK